MAADRYKYFRLEAAELSEQLAHGVLELEKNGLSAELLETLMRQAHTLKGAARVVRQIEIANAAHAMEDELTRCRELPQTPPNAGRLLAALDQIGGLLKQISPEPRTAEDPPKSRPSPSHLVRADRRELESARENVAEAQADLAQLRLDATTFFSVQELIELIERQSLAPRLCEARQYEALLRSTHSVASEMLQSFRRFTHRFSATLERAERELIQAHGTVEQLSLTSASSIFGDLERAVRDAATELEKDVRFEATGGDLKLDGYVLDAVLRALIHIVRNAVAHGLEAPDERRSQGKPATGTVRVSVSRDNGRLRFLCRDDGKGLDVQRLVQASGMPSHRAPSDEELLTVLLRGQLSTADHISAVAGRGVGMGVVRDAAERVGAELTMTNHPGEGVSFKISVPATVSSLSGVWVDAGGQIVALPLTGVQQTLRILPGQVVTWAGRSQLVTGSESIPHVPLHAVLGLPAPETPLGHAVVIRSRGRTLAVGVTRVLGTKTQIVHSLPVEAPSVALVSGAVLDTQGNPQLVLDPEALLEASRDVLFNITDEGRPPRPPILVIDDSLTTRMLEQSILESAGYCVELATSAEQALELAAANAYCLFLVDVEMPGIDGFTFVERTRADARLSKTPAILVSSRSAESDLARGAAVGASAYIVKERFDQRQLLHHVAEVLGAQ